MNFKYGLIICFSFIFGFMIYFFSQNMITIHWPFTHYSPNIPHDAITKKKATLYFWHHGSCKHETIDLIWHDDHTQTILYLINAWLTLLDEEKITEKKVTLQSVAFSPNKKEAFLSLDRQPYEKHNSTHLKLLWIEGILRTIRENGFDLETIQFLVHHQPFDDYHLDFSKPWPIEGFLHTSNTIV